MTVWRLTAVGDAASASSSQVENGGGWVKSIEGTGVIW